MADLLPNIYSSVVVTLVVAVVALVLRFISRRITKQKVWYDDWLCVVAFIFACGYASTIIISAVHFRLGQTVHGYDAATVDYIRMKTNLMLWLNELTYAASLAFSKLSILSFYWRIFKHTVIRFPIRFLLVAVVIWLLLRTFMVIFQCFPTRYIWDKTIDGHCMVDMNTFFLSTILTHCLLDVIILVLPVIPVFQMHLSWKSKIGVVLLFAAGTIVVIASIFVLVESIQYDVAEEEYTLEIGPFLYWAAVEVNMAIFSSCLPMMRPVFRRVLPAKPRTTGFESVDPIHLSQIKLPSAVDDGAGDASQSRLARARAKLSRLSGRHGDVRPSEPAKEPSNDDEISQAGTSPQPQLPV